MFLLGCAAPLKLDRVRALLMSAMLAFPLLAATSVSQLLGRARKAPRRDVASTQNLNEDVGREFAEPRICL